MDKNAANRPVLNANESRQGFLGRPVLLVLAASCILAAIFMLGLWLGMIGI